MAMAQSCSSQKISQLWENITTITGNFVMWSLFLKMKGSTQTEWPNGL